MQKIRPCLWFDGNAFEAASYYVALLHGGNIDGDEHSIVVNFELPGMGVMAINGGPEYPHTPAFSFFVNCKDQREVDALWDRLLADGGKPNRCGWCTDKFGVSWQIVPEALGELMSDSDSEKSQRVFQAMLQMTKLDVAGLQRAYDGVTS